jgi:heme/copper-type cytochrome/quinol oxidase subunit 2
MDYSTILGQATAYVQKFIDAAIPVAKQAYEIGLMTLQIDALSVLIPAFMLVLVLTWAFSYWYRKIRPNIESCMDIELNWVLVGSAYMIGMVWPVVQIFNMWLWIKLFKPELWLAKQAISAVLNATGAK